MPDFGQWRRTHAVLKVDTPFGPCWRRYNHDGFGQRDDGASYHDWGVGRAWPLLTGERGHYELAAGRDPEPYLQALESKSEPALGHDSSTNNLIRRYRKLRREAQARQRAASRNEEHSDE